MSNYYILLGLLVVLWIIVFYCNRKRLFTPASVVIIMEILSLVLAVIGTGSWNTVRDLHPKTMLLKTVAVFFFSMGGFIANSKAVPVRMIRFRISRSYRANGGATVRNPLEPYQLNKRYNRLLILVSLILFAAYCYAMFSAYGTWDILYVMAGGHDAYFGTNETVNPTMNSLAVQIMRIMKAIAYAYIIICGYHLGNRLRIRKSYFIPIVLYILCLILRGTRHGVILTIIALVLISYIFATKGSGRRISAISRNYIVACVILLTVLLAGFYALAPLLGQNTNNNAIAYMTYYFGAPIPSANEALIHSSKCNLTYSDVFGIHVFSGLYQSLNELGITNVKIPKQIGWINFSGRYPSNIFSAPYVLYLDFGCFGMILLSVFEGLIYTYLYKAMEKSKGTDYLACAIFVYLAPGVFNWYRTEDLFAADLSSTSTYIGILLTTLILHGNSVRLRISRKGTI